LTAGGEMVFLGMSNEPHWSQVSDALGELTQLVLPLEQFDPTYGLKDWDQLVISYYRDNESLKDRVDQLVGYLVIPKSLPEDVTGREKFYLLQRILCARDFMAAMFPPGREGKSPIAGLSPGQSPAEVIWWMLHDLWDHRFDHWLKLAAMATLGLFPLYGLVPQPEVDPD
jgi:hypothetical protein